MKTIEKKNRFGFRKSAVVGLTSAIIGSSILLLPNNTNKVKADTKPAPDKETDESAKTGKEAAKDELTNLPSNPETKKAEKKLNVKYIADGKVIGTDSFYSKPSNFEKLIESALPTGYKLANDYNLTNSLNEANGTIEVQLVKSDADQAKDNDQSSSDKQNNHDSNQNDNTDEQLDEVNDQTNALKEANKEANNLTNLPSDPDDNHAKTETAKKKANNLTNLPSDPDENHVKPETAKQKAAKQKAAAKEAAKGVIKDDFDILNDLGPLTNLPTNKNGESVDAINQSLAEHNAEVAGTKTENEQAFQATSKPRNNGEFNNNGESNNNIELKTNEAVIPKISPKMQSLDLSKLSAQLKTNNLIHASLFTTNLAAVSLEDRIGFKVSNVSISVDNERHMNLLHAHIHIADPGAWANYYGNADGNYNMAAFELIPKNTSNINYQFGDDSNQYAPISVEDWMGNNVQIGFVSGRWTNGSKLVMNPALVGQYFKYSSLDMDLTFNFNSDYMINQETSMMSIPYSNDPYVPANNTMYYTNGTASARYETVFDSTWHDLGSDYNVQYGYQGGRSQGQKAQEIDNNLWPIQYGGLLGGTNHVKADLSNLEEQANNPSIAPLVFNLATYDAPFAQGLSSFSYTMNIPRTIAENLKNDAGESVSDDGLAAIIKENYGATLITNDQYGTISDVDPNSNHAQAGDTTIYEKTHQTEASQYYANDPTFKDLTVSVSHTDEGSMRVYTVNVSNIKKKLTYLPQTVYGLDQVNYSSDNLLDKNLIKNVALPKIKQAFLNGETSITLPVLGNFINANNYPRYQDMFSHYINDNDKSFISNNNDNAFNKITFVRDLGDFNGNSTGWSATSHLIFRDKDTGKDVYSQTVNGTVGQKPGQVDQNAANKFLKDNKYLLDNGATIPEVINMTDVNTPDIIILVHHAYEKRQVHITYVDDDNLEIPLEGLASTVDDIYGTDPVTGQDGYLVPAIDFNKVLNHTLFQLASNNPTDVENWVKESGLDGRAVVQNGKVTGLILGDSRMQHGLQSTDLTIHVKHLSTDSIETATRTYRIIERLPNGSQKVILTWNPTMTRVKSVDTITGDVHYSPWKISNIYEDNNRVLSSMDGADLQDGMVSKDGHDLYFIASQYGPKIDNFKFYKTIVHDPATESPNSMFEIDTDQGVVRHDQDPNNIYYEYPGRVYLEMNENGITADANQLPQNQDFYIDYQPDIMQRHLTVHYLDMDNGGKEVDSLKDTVPLNVVWNKDHTAFKYSIGNRTISDNNSEFETDSNLYDANSRANSQHYYVADDDNAFQNRYQDTNKHGKISNILAEFNKRGLQDGLTEDNGTLPENKQNGSFKFGWYAESLNDEDMHNAAYQNTDVYLHVRHMTHTTQEEVKREYKVVERMPQPKYGDNKQVLDWNVSFNRDKTQDLVTGKASYGNWKDQNGKDISLYFAGSPGDTIMSSPSFKIDDIKNYRITSPDDRSNAAAAYGNDDVIFNYIWKDEHNSRLPYLETDSNINDGTGSRGYAGWLSYSRDKEYSVNQLRILNVPDNDLNEIAPSTTIYIDYKPVQLDRVIHYVTPDGTELSRQEVTGKTDTAVTAALKIPQGYHYVDGHDYYHYVYDNNINDHFSGSQGHDMVTQRITPEHAELGFYNTADTDKGDPNNVNTDFNNLTNDATIKHDLKVLVETNETPSLTIHYIDDDENGKEIQQQEAKYSPASKYEDIADLSANINTPYGYERVTKAINIYSLDDAVKSGFIKVSGVDEDNIIAYSDGTIAKGHIAYDNVIGSFDDDNNYLIMAIQAYGHEHLDAYIHFKHKIDHKTETKQKQRIFTFVMPDGSKGDWKTQDVTLSRSYTEDEVTHEKTYSDWQTNKYGQVEYHYDPQSPANRIVLDQDAAGHELFKASLDPNAYQMYVQYGDSQPVAANTVNGENVTINTPDVEHVTITFKAIIENRAVHFVDIDTKQVISQTSVEGHEGDSVTVDDTDAFNHELYERVDNKPIVVPLSVKVNSTPYIVYVRAKRIFIPHTSPHEDVDVIGGDYGDLTYPKGVTDSDLNQAVTRTINVYLPNQPAYTLNQTVNWFRDAYYTPSTGELDYGYKDANGNWHKDEWGHDGDSTNWKEYTPPQNDTLKPDIAHVEEVETGDSSDGPTVEDQVIDIHYRQGDDWVLVAFDDSDDSNNEVARYTVRGKQGENVKLNIQSYLNANLPNYEVDQIDQRKVANDQATITDRTPDWVIHIHHKTASLPVSDINDTQRTVTRIINITDPNSKESTIKQKIVFTRSATQDLVTGNIVYGRWEAHIPDIPKDQPDKDIMKYKNDNLTGDTVSQLTGDHSTASFGSAVIKHYGGYDTIAQSVDDDGNMQDLDNTIPESDLTADSSDITVDISYQTRPRHTFYYYVDQSKFDQAMSQGKTVAQAVAATKIDGQFNIGGHTGETKVIDANDSLPPDYKIVDANDAEKDNLTTSGNYRIADIKGHYFGYTFAKSDDPDYQQLIFVKYTGHPLFNSSGSDNSNGSSSDSQPKTNKQENQAVNFKVRILIKQKGHTYEYKTLAISGNSSQTNRFSVDSDLKDLKSKGGKLVKDDYSATLGKQFSPDWNNKSFDIVYELPDSVKLETNTGNNTAVLATAMIALNA